MSIAREIHNFAVTVGTGTQKSSYVTRQLAMPPRTIEEVRIEVPPGARGHVGFRLGLSGQAILPLEPDTWVVTDGRVIDWQLVDQPNSGAWEIDLYNTGNYDHTLYVTFLVTLPYGPGLAGIKSPLVL